MLHLDSVHVYTYIFFSDWVVKCWETLPFPWEIIAYGTLSFKTRVCPWWWKMQFNLAEFCLIDVKIADIKLQQNVSYLFLEFLKTFPALGC